MAIWQCAANGISQEHMHEYDEYMVVVQGRYTVITRDGEIELKPDRNTAFKEIFLILGVYCGHTNDSCIWRETCDKGIRRAEINRKKIRNG